MATWAVLAPTRPGRPGIVGMEYPSRTRRPGWLTTTLYGEKGQCLHGCAGSALHRQLVGSINSVIDAFYLPRRMSLADLARDDDMGLRLRHMSGHVRPVRMRPLPR